ncbi:hypothetical protein AURDEDRAFT_178146 [Auricularia subglabra TFB-10046 SS5]|uniref:Uncharacterized protein n=1 Tax=Auricularia subglabra (strain TFB-10046 / SS5) TaxID=717982 RepID=J0L8R3_AURST|nr:hypothetical protein AURDEDRAFT_178146 [Auricularia subglabra TFB-10046 SS5]
MRAHEPRQAKQANGGASRSDHHCAPLNQVANAHLGENLDGHALKKIIRPVEICASAKERKGAPVARPAPLASDLAIAQPVAGSSNRGRPQPTRTVCEARPHCGSRTVFIARSMKGKKRAAPLLKHKQPQTPRQTHEPAAPQHHSLSPSSRGNDATTGEPALPAAERTHHPMRRYSSRLMRLGPPARLAARDSDAQGQTYPSSERWRRDGDGGIQSSALLSSATQLPLHQRLVRCSGGNCLLDGHSDGRWQLPLSARAPILRLQRSTQPGSGRGLARPDIACPVHSAFAHGCRPASAHDLCALSPRRRNSASRIPGFLSRLHVVLAWDTVTDYPTLTHERSRPAHLSS